MQQSRERICEEIYTIGPPGYYQSAHDLKATDALVHVMCIVPAGIYLLKVNNRNSRTRCEISTKLTIKTPE